MKIFSEEPEVCISIMLVPVLRGTSLYKLWKVFFEAGDEVEGGGIY